MSFLCKFSQYSSLRTHLRWMEAFCQGKKNFGEPLACKQTSALASFANHICVCKGKHKYSSNTPFRAKQKGHQIGVLFYLTTKREGTFICNFIANEVHKRGKSRCLLASIRLAEVLFRKKKPLLFSAVLSFLCALLKGGHPPILHLIRQETYSFPTRGRLFFFRFFATLD